MECADCNRPRGDHDDDDHAQCTPMHTARCAATGDDPRCCYPLRRTQVDAVMARVAQLESAERMHNLAANLATAFQADRAFQLGYSAGFAACPCDVGEGDYSKWRPNVAGEAAP